MNVSWEQLSAAGEQVQGQAPVMGASVKPPPGFDVVAALTTGIIVVTSFIAKRPGNEHWQASPKEAEEIAGAIDGVLPDDIAVGPWGTLAIAVGSFTIPRVMVSKMNAAQARAVARKQAQGQPRTKQEVITLPAPQELEV